MYRCPDCGMRDCPGCYEPPVDADGKELTEEEIEAQKERKAEDDAQAEDDHWYYESLHGNW